MEPIATDLSVRAFRLLFQILRFIGLLFTGILLIHLFPRLSRRATDRAWSRPATTFGIGLGVFVLVPVAAVASLFTVILAPAALLALGLWLFGLFAGAVPALAALGRRVSRSRYGIMGSFVVAAVVWRLLRIIPLAGFLIYLLIVIWGMGAWTLSLWDGWRGTEEGTASDETPVAGLAEPGPRMELLGLEIPPVVGSGDEGSPVPGPQSPDNPSIPDDPDRQ